MIWQYQLHKYSERNLYDYHLCLSEMLIEHNALSQKKAPTSS